jgi:L-ascorbate metabolism protein UlaG (beta-lactamase superfamily)
VTLTYYGHSAFLWTSESNVRVLIDPFGNTPGDYWFLLPFPRVRADIVLVTHEHFDHNAVEGLPGGPMVIRDPGEFGRNDISIRGVLDLHSGTPGVNGLHNTIYVIETGGVRYCHMGDNRPELPADAREQIGQVDVLMTGVDDSMHLMNYEQVDSLVEYLDPKIVIPMHYYLNGITTRASTLKNPKGWLDTRTNVKRLGIETLNITPNNLPSQKEVWVFDPLLS